MTFLRILFLCLVALALLILALANLAPVTLRVLPEPLAELVGIATPMVTLPLFVTLFLAIAIGLLIGFTWEWLREHKHRSEAARQRAERERLERRLEKSREPDDGDEVLALVERPRAS